MSGHAVSVGDNRGFFMTFRSESARVRHSCIFRRWRLSTAGIERRHGASSSYRAGTGTARAADMARSCNHKPHDIWKTQKKTRNHQPVEMIKINRDHLHDRNRVSSSGASRNSGKDCRIIPKLSLHPLWPGVLYSINACLHLPRVAGSGARAS